VRRGEVAAQIKTVSQETGVPINLLCAALGVPPSSFYRLIKPDSGKNEIPRERKRRSSRALSESERAHILCIMHDDRFCDKPPSEIYASLLDEGIFLCSQRTMYRILRSEDEVRERRNQLRHPKYKKPELIATAPNQVWSWDITKLRGPAKFSYYYLYVFLDIYSRHVVGWMVAANENAVHAKDLIRETCRRQAIDRNQLFIHSDRGSSMTSKTVAMLLSDLGITKSLNRPHVSNDNPYSESQFKTLKYRPNYPERFGCLEDARVFCETFFDWYNNEHYHSGIALMTPSDVHYGLAEECNQRRQLVLSEAFERTPERFVKGSPKVQNLPKEVWINKPDSPKVHDTICSIAIIGD
jgi:putative transposase